MAKNDKLLTNCVDVLTASVRKEPDIHSFGTFLRREDQHHLAVGSMAKQAGSSEHLALGVPEHKGGKFPALDKLSLCTIGLPGLMRKRFF